ncbi:MAG: hypothetical protein LCH52_16510 [Bacteroidetes bacterium]|nr:hypothetical protein [Bacteroidota bacterium]
MDIKYELAEAYKDLIWKISRQEFHSALAKVRFILEKICDYLYLHFLDKDFYQIPLSKKLERIQNTRGISVDVYSQIKSIQYLSNVGHHDESVDARYFLQPALISLSYVVRWLFEEVLKEKTPKRYYFYEYFQTDNGLILKNFLPNGSYDFEEKVILNSPLEYDYQGKIAFLKRNDFNLFIVIPTSLTSEMIIRPECEYLRDKVKDMITEKLQTVGLSRKFSVMVISDYLYFSYDFISFQNAIMIGTYENQFFCSVVPRGIVKEDISEEFFIIEHIANTYLCVKTAYKHYIGKEIDRLLKNPILDEYLKRVVSSLR